MSADALKKIVHAIKKEKKFILFAHESPDGDAIGSQLAMAGALRKLGKDAVVVCEDLPAKYRFLPGCEDIQRIPPRDAGERAALFFDTPSPERSGENGNGRLACRTVINIDHHVSNTRYGDLNWVEKNASSVGEMLFELIKRLGVKIENDIAECLYVAILTDTGMFQYANTTKKTHSVVGELLDSGIDQFKIYQKVYENIPLAKLKLLGESIRTLRMDCGGRLASMWVTRDMLKRCGATLELTEDIINTARSIEGTVVAVVFKETEKKGVYRVSFRSKSKKADVNRAASVFGGGGHIAAAGCTVRGKKEEVESKVLAAVKKELRIQNGG